MKSMTPDQNHPNADFEMVIDHMGWPTYEQMVKNLFKTDIPGHHSGIMHAVVGLASEVNEIMRAKSLKNIKEEAGDLEFYLEAARQHAGDPGMVAGLDPKYMVGYIDFGVGEICTKIAIQISIMMDTVKKSWIYGRELKVLDLNESIDAIQHYLKALYVMIGTTQEEVRFFNMVKLIDGKTGRYASGVYSDEQANARADKKQTYTTVPGDTLTAVAKAHGIRVQTLLDLNPNLKNQANGAKQAVWNDETLDWDLVTDLTLNLPDAE